ncbi:MAG: HAD family hydrolase [Alphaproteobacteria bacterium]
MSLSAFPRPQAILFDWDNTLVDVWPAVSDALNAAFAAMGHAPWTLAETKARVRKSLRDSFPEMFGARWTEARDVFYARYEAEHLKHLVPMAGAAATLAGLKGLGLYLGVVSNKNGHFLRAEAVALGWDGYFGRLVGATDAATDKPAPDPVHMALDGSGIPAGRDVWFVGDGAIDVQCALAAGLTPVILDGPDIRAELMRHNVDEFVPHDAFIEGLSALLSLQGPNADHDPVK